MKRTWAIGIACIGIAGAVPAVARADAVSEARALRRDLRYEEARTRLEAAQDETSGDARARLLLEMAAASGDARAVQRLLREAGQNAQDVVLRRQADLELALLDYARGNYNSVRTRLRDRTDAEAQLLAARAAIGLGQPAEAKAALRGRNDPQARLLLAWATRETGDPRAALDLLEGVTRDDALGLPTALLWKSECEAALGLSQPALDTAALLQSRFPHAPETVLIEPTLASLRRSAQRTTAPVATQVLLQLGAFEDRTNALRFRDELPTDVAPVRVDELERGARRYYAVMVGPFDSRQAAEAYGRTRLDPIDVEWRVTQQESP
jgi:hypothetical protein